MLDEMIFRVHIKRKNLAIKFYGFMMAVMLIARYLLNLNMPNAMFLAVAAIPAIFGSTSELLACTVSFIPLSPTFQYKYALLISLVALLLKNRWRQKSGGAILLVFIMMTWELLHFVSGGFSIVEYIRDFAELLFLGALIMVRIDNLDHKMIVRFFSVFVVAVCLIMFTMQLQQNDFNILKVFSRSAAAWRFGKGNMNSGRFALNFDANILGFICNLSTSGLLLLRKRKEQLRVDTLLIMASLFLR